MTFSWGVVHTVTPLTVIEDGSSNALPVIQSLVDPSSLTIGDMVRVELAQGGRVVVYGLPGGDPRVGVNEGAIAALEDVHLQLDTTNSVAKMVTQHGMGKITGVVTSGIDETVTFPVAFASVPVIQGGFIGARTPQGAFDPVGLRGFSRDIVGKVSVPTTTGLVAAIHRTGGYNLSASWDFYYSWSATGVLA